MKRLMEKLRVYRNTPTCWNTMPCSRVVHSWQVWTVLSADLEGMSSRATTTFHSAKFEGKVSMKVRQEVVMRVMVRFFTPFVQFRLTPSPRWRLGSVVVWNLLALRMRKELARTRRMLARQLNRNLWQNCTIFEKSWL